VANLLSKLSEFTSSTFKQKTVNAKFLVDIAVALIVSLILIC